MMKKKMKRFQDGGVADENFTPAQLEFLGGADRTDPYILARMRSKFPDAPKEMPQKASFDTAEGQNKNIGDDVRARAMRSVSTDTAPVVKPKKTAPARTAPAKTEAAKEIIKDKPKASDDNAYLKRSRAVTDAVKKTAGEFTKLRNYNPLAKLSDLAEGVSSRVSRFTKATPAEQAEKFRSRSMTAQNNMKAGGKVSSASKRADGCAVRGKTRA
jgi:hypothetical protein